VYGNPEVVFSIGAAVFFLSDTAVHQGFIPFYDQVVNPSMTICGITDSAKAKTNPNQWKTRHFPNSSP
jgi:hypothetical protein